MRETPLDILDRARRTFVASLMDSIGKADAGADFYYAALSAKRRGYILDGQDDGLVKMFYSVMKEEEGPLAPQGYDLNVEARAGPVGMGTGSGQQSIATYLSHQAGQQFVDSPSYQDGRVVPALLDVEGNISANRGFAGAHVSMLEGNEKDPYGTHNFFDERFNPLHNKYHDHVGEFYYDEDGNSQSKIDAEKEWLWEQHHMDGPQQFLRNHNQYGKLTDNATNHALYEHDYEHNWKNTHDAATDSRIKGKVAELEEMGMSEKQIEHELRSMHIADKKAEWADNLGFWDYMLGMEWLTPEERNEAYEHLGKYGVSNRHRPLTINGINYGPRFIRNFHQRFAGLYNMWTRPPGHPGETMKNRPIGLPDAQNTRLENLEAMTRHQGKGKGTTWDVAMQHLMSNLSEDEYEGDASRAGIPYIHDDEDGRRSIQFHTDKQVHDTDEGISAEMVRLLLNVDDNRQLFESGQHPIHGDKWNKEDSPFTQEEVDDFYNMLARESSQNKGAGRISRNNAHMHFGTFLDPEYYHQFLTDDMIEQGDADTLSTYWQRPWMKGGMGKQANDLFNLLHQHSILPEEWASADVMQPPSEAEREEELVESDDPYANIFAEIAAREAEPEEKPAKPKRAKAARLKEYERSLLFNHFGHGLFTHHEVDEESGSITNHGMIPFIGPFGQPSHELTRMVTGKGGIPRKITVADVGDVSDMELNLNPKGVRESSRIKGTAGTKRNTARRRLSLSPKYHGDVYVKLHDLRSAKGDASFAPLKESIMAQGAQQNWDQKRLDTELAAAKEEFLKNRNVQTKNKHAELNGYLSGTYPTKHPDIHTGSVYDMEPSLRMNSHEYHTIGTLIGAANPTPASRIQELGRPETVHTLEYPEDLEGLKSHRIRPERLDNAIRDKEEELSKVNSKTHPQLHRALSAELDDLKSQAELVQHTPSDTREYTSDPRVVRYNPAGQVSLIGAPEEGGIHPQDEERYKLLSEKVNELSLELEDASEERKNALHSEIKEYNDELNRLERRMTEPTHTPYVGAHVPQMVANKLAADTQAIADAGEQVVSGMNPEVYNAIFGEHLPLETLEANIRMFARAMNDYLHTAPSEHHGLTTTSMGESEVEKEMAGADAAYDIKGTVHNNPFRIGIQQLINPEQMAEDLGLDYTQPHVQKTLDRLRNDVFMPKINSLEQSEKQSFNMPVMTLAQYLKSKGLIDQDIDSNYVSNILRTTDNRSREFKAYTELASQVSREARKLMPQKKQTGEAMTGTEGVEELNEKLGLNFHISHNPDHRKDLGTGLSVQGGKGKKDTVGYKVQQLLDSLIVSDPTIEPQRQTTVQTKGRGFIDLPIGPIGPDSHALVHSLYNSAGFQHEYGDEYHPTFDYQIKRNGDIKFIPVPEGKPMRLISPMESFWNAVAPHLVQSGVHGLDYVHHDGSHRGTMVNEAQRKAAQFKVDDIGQMRSQRPTSVGKSDVNLADLTNPDIIRKELGKEVPLLQPMHRIFELDDLEHLRGFTGDWIVSVMPEGERGFVKKEDEEIESKPFKLSKEDKENFKKVTENDFHADVIKTEEGYYIFDVIEYDEKEVHSAPLSDRIKVLRGGMEGIENIHVPSASDTRLTDDAGLELIVEDLQKEHDKLLLRDASSTYMVGEMRHPKWVLLNPGSDVVLRVLERRGNGPYTYRLGTGPITQEDSLGDRAVESGGDTYMDVGAAFDSSEKFNEGDHVRVNVANVGEMETSEGQKIYTVSGSDIKEEAEGEGLVSQETLGILAKSDEPQWLCEVDRAASGIRVAMPQGDVVYKCTQSGRLWTVHSPLAANSYLIRLSESQRQYWSPVAGALLKANLEVKEEVHESEGDAQPLIKPKKVKDTDWWDEEKKKVLVKGLELVEKLLKSGAGAVGQSSTGTMGLGIDYATPIESPTGPTNLHDSKTMPDYDNRKKPGEDYSIEPETEDSEPAKHLSIPVDEGVLEITEDSAVLHT